MSYPTRRQFALSTQASLSATANVFNLSQAAQAGNLLVACLAGDKNTGPIGVTDNTGSGTWNLTSSNSVVITGNSVSLYIAWKVAVGGETQVTMTTTTAPSTGNTGYLEEMVDDGAGAWQLVAKAQPAYSDTARTSAASGTTDTADYDGRALAVAVIDSQMTYTGSFSNSFTTVNTPVSPSGSGGGNAGCWVATKNIPAGTTTNTTFTSSGSDQLTCAIAVFGKVESAAAAPTVSAGADASVATGAAFTRTATENDNGSAITSRGWSLISSPGGAATYSSTTTGLSYTPTVAGTYVFRYSATNAVGTTTDDMTLTVTAASGAPIVSAGPDTTIALNDTFTYTATENDNGSAITSRGWTVFSGPASVGASNTAQGVSFTPTVAGTYVMRYSATNANGTTTDDMVLTVTDTSVYVSPGAFMNFGTAPGKLHYGFDIARTSSGSRQLYYPSEIVNTPIDFVPEFTVLDGWLQAAARADGPTTSGTNNARSEGRETQEGTESTHINFNHLDGNTHWQRVRCRVMEHPLVNNVGVSVAQLHSGGDDMMMVRTRYDSATSTNKLVLRQYESSIDNAQDKVVLKENYQFGDEFDLLFLIHGGWVYVFYQDAITQDFTKYVWKFAASALPSTGTYMFKWGCYNQFYEGTAGISPTDMGRAQFRYANHYHTGWSQPENYFGAPQVTIPATATATLNSSFQETISATGSPTQYQWSIIDGPDASGTIIGTAATLSWTPTVAGTYRIIGGAKNAFGWSNPQIMTVTASSAPVGGTPASVRDTVTGSGNSQVSSYSITLPTREIGDALVVGFSNDEVGSSTAPVENFATPDTASANRGWTVLATQEQGGTTNHRVTILYKALAEGGAADALTVTLVDPEEATWVATSVANPGPNPPDLAMDEGGATSEVKGIPRTGLTPAPWLSLVFLGIDSNPNMTQDPQMDPADPNSASWTRIAAINPTTTSSASTFAWAKTYPDGTTSTDPPKIGSSIGTVPNTVGEQWIRYSLLFEGEAPTSQTYTVAATVAASAVVPTAPVVRKVRLVASRPVSTGHLTAVALRSTYRAKARPVVSGEVSRAELVVRALKRIAASAQFAGVMRTASGDVDVTTRLYTTRPPIEAVVTKAKVTRVTLADKQLAAAEGTVLAKLTKVLFELDHSLLADSLTTGRISTMKEMVAEKPIWTSGVVRNARINDPFTWKGLAEAFAVAEILQVRSLKSHAIVSGVTDDATSQVRVRLYNDQLMVTENVTDADVIRIGYLDTAALSVIEGVLTPRSLYVVPDFGTQTIRAESVEEPAVIIRGIPHSVRAIAEGTAQVDNPLFVASLRTRAIGNGDVPQRKLIRVTLHDDRAITEGVAFYDRELLSRVRKLPSSLISAEGLVASTVESIRVTPFVNQALLSEVESSAPFLAVVTGLWQAIYADSIVLYGSQRVIITTAVGRSVTDTSVATMRIIRGRAYAEAVVAEADLVNLGIKQFLYVDVEIPQANLLTLKQYSEHLVGDGLARTDLHRTGYISSIVAIIDLNGDVIRGELPTEPRLLAAPKPPAEETHVIKFTRPFGVLRT